jgi:hypothetical protein
MSAFAAVSSSAGTFHAEWHRFGGDAGTEEVSLRITAQLHSADDGDRYEIDIRDPLTGDLLGSLDRRAEYETNRPNGALCPPSCDHVELTF